MFIADNPIMKRKEVIVMKDRMVSPPEGREGHVTGEGHVGFPGCWQCPVS